MQIEDLLVQKNLDMLLGDKPKTMSDAEWEGLDRKAMLVVPVSLTKNVAFNILKENTAKSVMEALSNMYEKRSPANKVFLIRELVNTKMRKCSSVTEHINKLNSILARLLSMGIKFDDVKFNFCYYYRHFLIVGSCRCCHYKRTLEDHVNPRQQHNSNSGGNMNGPILYELKKQASFFFKETIKTARLALTDVTPAQLLAEEASNGNPGGPDIRTLKTISEAAFGVDDYCRIVDVLHKRIRTFSEENWRASYKALIVLEYLLTHGPKRIAEEFQNIRCIINQMGDFQYVDDQGFNWGVNVRKKSERVLQLLKEEQDKARKITRGIQGFSSFSMRTSSPEQEKVKQESSLKELGRCKSDVKSFESLFSNSNQSSPVKTKAKKPLPTNMDNLSPESSKLNMTPKARVINEDEGKRSYMRESKPLPVEHKNERKIDVVRNDFHPFNNDDEHLSVMSLLAPVDQVRAC